MKIQHFPFSQDELKRNLLVKDISDHQIVSSIKSTQKNFTVSREKIGIYSRSELDVSSYSLFYMPTDFPKLSMVLRELPLELLNELRDNSFDIYDIGCGPGTFSFAWREFFPKSNHRFHLIDRSSEMLKQARSFSENLVKLPDSSYHEEIRSLSDGGARRVAVFGHSINEMGLKEAQNYLSAISPDLIIMLAPGTPDAFKLIMEWRDNYSDESGYKVLYPCLSLAECPILSNQNSDDWCHQILREKLTPELQQLGQRLSIDRRTIAFIGHVYAREELFAKRDESFSSEINFTLIRFLGETKFSWQYLGCSGSNKELIKLEVMKKTIEKSKHKAMSSILVGQRVLFNVLREVSPKHLRGVIK